MNLSQTSRFFELKVRMPNLGSKIWKSQKQTDVGSDKDLPKSNTQI